jgi:UDP-N-acetylglucosamine 1-carboxyvinyltransferase
MRSSSRSGDWFSNRETKLRGITMSHRLIFVREWQCLIAALAANGKSTINNIEQIDRGYQYIDTRLRALGAKIDRID